MVLLSGFGITTIFLFVAVYRRIMHVLSLLFRDAEIPNVRRSLITEKGLLSNP